MKLREVKAATEEFVAMPRTVKNALAAVFVAQLIAIAALIIVIVRSM